MRFCSSRAHSRRPSLAPFFTWTTASTPWAKRSERALVIGCRGRMEYRRFGRTNQKLSVITLGGMRYHEGWTPPRDELPARSIEQCRDTVLRAFEAGINHIETARGYGKSEHLYGKVLHEELGIPRERYLFMTKGAPDSADATRRL